MKDYIEYMDSISVDTALHDKIMNKLQRKSVPQRRKRLTLRYAGLAACAVLLLFSVWKIPGLFSNDLHDRQIAENNPDHIISPGTQHGNESIGTDVDDPNDPNSVAHPLYSLSFNTGNSLIQADASWAFGCFDYDLTDEQVKVVFPGLDLTIGATAFYGVDGKLITVTAVESFTAGRMDHAVKVNDSYTRTEIKLGEGQIIEDCVVVFEDTPQISDVYGIQVTAYMLDTGGIDTVYFQSEFMLDGIAYRISMYDNITDGQTRMTMLVNEIIKNGAADLSVLANPVIPDQRFDELTLDAARLDPDFGSFIPMSVPNGFEFESSYRVVTTRENSLSAHWGKPNNYIEFRVFEATEYDREHIVSGSEREKYDMSLYSIPLSESVPNHLWEYVDNPVFLFEELSLDIIKARAIWVDNDRGDTPAWRMSFSVLYGNVLVRVGIKGATPEQVFEMLDNTAPR